MTPAARRTPPPSRPLGLGNVALALLTVSAVLASAHFTQLVTVPGLPAVGSEPGEYVGWATSDTPITPSDTAASGVVPEPVDPAVPGTVPVPAPDAGVERVAPALPSDPVAPVTPSTTAGGAGPVETAPPVADTGAPAVVEPVENPVDDAALDTGAFDTGAFDTAPFDGGPALGMLAAAPCGSCGGDVYYVDNRHPNASDANTGLSENQPWRTVVHAAARARAGDTVYVKAGTYDDGWVEIVRSGRAGAPIVLSAYPGDERKAVIVNAGIRSTGNSHIEIRGFKILHSPAQGIRVEGPPDAAAPPATDIVIRGNYTRDTCSSGISVWGVDWGDDPGDYDNIRNVDIGWNLLELGTNGCKNEIITVANGAVNVDVHHNVIRYGDPNMTGGDEGIDFKEGVRDSRIRNNVIYDLSDKAIYIDGGSGPQDPLVTNIEISSNFIHDLPSSGISIVTEGRGDVDGIYVVNNVIHSVDGDGLIVYDHPGGAADGGTVRNVQFVNNTVVDSGRRHSGYGGIRVNHSGATGIVIRNNIASGNNGYDIRGEAETTIDHNQCREGFCEARTDPRFQNPDLRDYRLTASSPAIDLGSHDLAPSSDHAGAVRPTDQPVDAGAYDASRLSSELPVILPLSAAAIEGDSGRTVLEIPVRLSKPATHEVTATWYVHPFHAELGTDVVEAGGTIRFAPGQTELTITTEVIGDTVPEGDEWFVVPVRDPTGADLGGLWGLGLAMITDDD